MSKKHTITKQEQKEFTYLSLLLLASNDKAVFPELMYILDNDDFMNLVNVYGGSYIRIPTKDELRIAFTTAIYYYHVTILKEQSFAVCIDYDISPHECRMINIRITKFEKYIKKHKRKIPNMFMKSEFLTKIGKYLNEK